jgi:hypothetical protein
VANPHVLAEFRSNDLAAAAQAATASPLGHLPSCCQGKRIGAICALLGARAYEATGWSASAIGRLATSGIGFADKGRSGPAATRAGARETEMTTAPLLRPEFLLWRR